MKKILILLSVLLLTVSCYSENDKQNLQAECKTLVSQKAQLESTIVRLNQQISDLKAERNAYRAGREPRYIVKFKIKQGTFTLDIFEHIKNNINAIELEIPVPKEFYNKLSVGQDLTNKFKWGSLVMDGDFSNLHVRISGKRIE